MSRSQIDLAETLPRRDLASHDLWERSLERSLYRRKHAALGRKQLSRRKSASVAVSATMVSATAAPSVVAAQTPSGDGSSAYAPADVQPTALEDPSKSILLRIGDTGSSVAAVQRELAIQVDPAVEVDGIFGPQTRAAVIDFQQANGLTVDGIVGPETWRALFENRNVAFIPAEPSAEVAAANGGVAPTTRPASGGSGRSGEDFLVMVQNKGSGAEDADTADDAEASAERTRVTGAGTPGSGATKPASDGGSTEAGGQPGSSPGGDGSANGDGSSSDGGGSTDGGDGSAGGGNGGGSNAGGGHAGGVTVCGLSKLRWPTRGHNLTSPFGDGRNHGGIDISYGGIDGDPVKAAACGRISFAGKQSGYGKMVCIQHTPRFETCYAHLSRIRFSSGYVKTGEVIGRVGNTGNSTGPHLHFETRVRGNAKNPIPYLRGKDVPGENKRYKRMQRREERQRQLEERETGDTRTASRDSGTTRSRTAEAEAPQPVVEPAPAPAPAPVEEAPVEPAPVEEAPVEPAPVEEAPVEPAPVEEAPVEPAPVEEAPVEPAPAPAPVEEAPVEPAPVEPAPTETAPVEEAPVVEEPVPTETAPAPTETAPAPTETVPTETAPAPTDTTEQVPDPTTEEEVTTTP